MTFEERLYRAELARIWREYRETRHLPVAHASFANDAKRVISTIRSKAFRRGASRPPAWAVTPQEIAA